MKGVKLRIDYLLNPSTGGLYILIGVITNTVNASASYILLRFTEISDFIVPGQKLSDAVPNFFADILSNPFNYLAFFLSISLFIFTFVFKNILFINRTTQVKKGFVEKGVQFKKNLPTSFWGKAKVNTGGILMGSGFTAIGGAFLAISEYEFRFWPSLTAGFLLVCAGALGGAWLDEQNIQIKENVGKRYLISNSTG